MDAMAEQLGQALHDGKAEAEATAGKSNGGAGSRPQTLQPAAAGGRPQKSWEVGKLGMETGD